MAEKVHRIHTLSDDAPWVGGLPPVGSPEHPLLVRMLDRALSIQRPVVVAHLRSIRLRKLLCGKPVILIENGRILQENLRSTRVTLDELTGHLREKDVLDIQSVQYAILETNGNLSVFPYPKEKPASARDAGIKVRQQFLPITIVSDGEILEHNLAIAKKDKQWLTRILEEKHADLQDTWLLTVDGANHVTFFRKEI